MKDFLSFGNISIIANIVLTLLLIFQWDRKYASEQVTKNNILATRRMVSRIQDNTAKDIIDSVDATLATLDARSPFSDWAKGIMVKIQIKFKKEEAKKLDELAEIIEEK